MKKIDLGKNINFIALLIVLLFLIVVIALLSTTKDEKNIIIDGLNNGAYNNSINNIYNEGLDNVDKETARLANAYISDRGVKKIILINPTIKNIEDFYKIARHHRAKLIIGSTSNQVELQSKLFEAGLSSKEVQFQLKNWNDRKPNCSY